VSIFIVSLLAYPVCHRIFAIPCQPGIRPDLVGQALTRQFWHRAREFPGWIKAICIRVVTGVDEEKEKMLNAPERFDEAFRGIDPGEVMLKTFHDPTELNDVIAALAA
jgi:hypothetical protein